MQLMPHEFRACLGIVPPSTLQQKRVVKVQALVRGRLARIALAGIHTALLASKQPDGREFGMAVPGKRLTHYSWRALADCKPFVEWEPTHSVVAGCESVLEPTGTTTWAAHELALSAYKIGTMVAGNSGRAAGGCGLLGRVTHVHMGHRTQEEDLISNWMLTASANSHDAPLWNAIYQETIDRAWGLTDVSGDAPGTIQGVDDYRTADDPRVFGDAWVVPGCRLSAKVEDRRRPGRMTIDKMKAYQTSLIFVAGPNADESSCDREPSSSMRRTFSNAAFGSYDIFK